MLLELSEGEREGGDGFATAADMRNRRDNLSEAAKSWAGCRRVRVRAGVVGCIREVMPGSLSLRSVLRGVSPLNKIGSM